MLGQLYQASQDTAKFGSMVVLSTSLLQIAQYILILAHDTDQKLAVLSTYRSYGASLKDIKGKYILDVIWEGRNQAVHFQSTVYLIVQTVFDALINAGEVQLVGYRLKENMAYEIIKLLGWNGANGYENFVNDMKSLAI